MGRFSFQCLAALVEVILLLRGGEQRNSGIEGNNLELMEITWTLVLHWKRLNLQRKERRNQLLIYG
jgi:hypothetical protein